MESALNSAPQAPIDPTGANHDDGRSEKLWMTPPRSHSHLIISRSSRVNRPADRAKLPLMFTRIACPTCGHVGVTAASLPRVLVCSKCEHGAVIKSGMLARSPIITQEEEAAKRAACERHAPRTPAT
jgi:hypothetical protein